MSWHPDEPPADDEPLGRPFLTAAGRPLPNPAPGERPPSGAAWPPEQASAVDADDVFAPVALDHHVEVRPYLLTGGRTYGGGAALAMETVVLATGVPPARGRGPDPAGLERARILRLCDRPCSAAEVAARLHLPLQVALVLVTDLVAEGLLDATAVGASQADDVLFLERLIAGVASL